ncbi:GGDEF domain-containing protein [Deinococcus maricopensis]|uniref:7TM domain sensor diguanylate cyclase n=1 Tax=Deinococcus maricopensis (strain DSM 21211 / LMG 22137 / NRRL B-23946 / LB-34) TaxID=709986 RepID=E8U9U6_DEIML|nr:GGDEF domain-containing protein [Deinococcus maricopensis]ADV67835.1 7TM domain sensor diguanylate cyclase [Deinococcus maricopensis DSM 21211]
MTLPAQALYRAVVTLIALICLMSGARAAHPEQPLRATQPLELGTTGTLYAARDVAFPRDLRSIDAWTRTHAPARRVNLFGGAYWLTARITNDTQTTDWVFNPHGTLIEAVEARLYTADGRVQTLHTGQRSARTYPLHYGQNITLPPGQSAELVVRFQSLYYASAPDFSVVPRAAYTHSVLWDNLLTFGALGALLSLAVYNFFIAANTRDRSLFFYAAYMLMYAVAWAFTFHVFADLFGVYDLRLYYVGFFLLPVLNTLFYRRFLRLGEQFPTLDAVSRVNIWLPLALLPSCLIAPQYAHALATLAIGVWVIIALICGIVSWRSGFRPARYFVGAFLALLIPASLILPANVGLIPDLVPNSELMTLLGGTLDGMLLAFALAERINILQREKDASMVRLQHALQLAYTDVLTGIGNRHAFDMHMEHVLSRPATHDPPVLILMDLDGLKSINDGEGHARGDDLLRTFAQALHTRVPDSVRCFRLGGDEFTLIARESQAGELHDLIDSIERDLRLHGFPNFGVSYGAATAAHGTAMAEVYNQADSRMYRHKAARKGSMLAPLALR